MDISLILQKKYKITEQMTDKKWLISLDIADDHHFFFNNILFTFKIVINSKYTYFTIDNCLGDKHGYPKREYKFVGYSYI